LLPVNTRKINKIRQHGISIGLVLIVSIACFLFVDLVGYRVVALVLLVTVSLLAMLFEISPVLIAAVLSALIWNFFFIPPIFTFHVDHAEDLLMFLMYFLVAMVNAVLTFKIREAETIARDKEEKENALRHYNVLLNSLSHELRTPIATIIGAVDTLKENNKQLTELSKEELLNSIDLASIRLNRQVENLLNMSRVETGMFKLKLDWCDLNDLIHSIVQKIQPSSVQQRILIQTTDNLPLFKIDAVLIEQAIQNILHNAVQYTPEGTQIKIDLAYQIDKCIIIISDQGKGFPEEEIHLVFDKFYRLHNSPTGGTGLGLSIAKGFTEAHHGSIKLENKPEGGARFTLEIPAETSFINNLKNE